MRFKDRAVLFFATGGFMGRLPLAPGTFGTVWAFPLCYFLSRTTPVIAFCLTALAALAAIWLSGRAEKILGATDPGAVVIDEVAGFMVALWGLPYTIHTVVFGFFVFRGFDILKPFPIRYLERRVPGGTGVVLDDLLAGLYTNLVLRATLLTLSRLGMETYVERGYKLF